MALDSGFARCALERPGMTKPYNRSASAAVMRLASSGTASIARVSMGRMSLTLSATSKSKLNSPRMNSSFFIWSMSAHSGSQKSLDIGDQHWLPVAAELRPGELLDQLLQRADAAGQRHEGVRHVEHLLFALVHVAGDDQVLHVLVRVLARDQELGDDAVHLPAVFHHR